MDNCKIDIVRKILEGKVVIAPLAGYTNIAYRKICKEMGASLVFTEMVSCKGLIYDNDKTFEYLNTIKEEHPLACQIFGGDIDEVVAGAKLVLNENCCEILDINMGCPVKKVLKQGAGSQLLLEPNKIYEMVKRVVEVSNVPVSCKIRAGWDRNSINCIEVAKAIERAGASMITIHGRTKSDLYGGKVNLDFIKMVKENVNIPVIGNGDIKSIEDAVKMLEYTKCDAIMVGRGALGNPWLIRDLYRYFNGLDKLPEPTIKERIDMIKYHYEELAKIKCEKIAILEIRSLAAWYVRSVPNNKSFKLKLNQVTKKEELYELLDSLLESNDEYINNKDN